MGLIWSRLRSATQAPQDERHIKLLKECKDSINNVDEAMVGLFKSIDAVHATAEMLVTYLNITKELDDDHGNANQNVHGSMPVAARLLVMVERVVCKEKDASIKSVSTFLHFIINNANEIFKSDLEEFQELLLDIYKSDPDVCQYNGGDHLETILKENETLKQEYDSNKRDLEKLQSKHHRLIEERNSSRKLNDQLQNEVQNFRENVDTLNKQYNELKFEKEELQKQSSVLKGMEINHTTLLTKCNDLELLNENLKLELEDVKQQTEAFYATNQQDINKKDQEITEIRKSEKSLEEKNISLQESIENTEKQHNTAVQQKDEMIAELKCERESHALILNEKQTKHNRTIGQKDKEIAEMKISISSYQDQIRNKKEQMSKHEQDIASLRSERTLLNEENIKLSTERNKLSESLAEVEKVKTVLLEEKHEQSDEIHTLREVIEEKTSTLQTLRDEIDLKNLNIQSLKEECDEMKSKITTLTIQNEEKDKELIEIKSKKKTQVQLYCQQKLGWTATIEKELIDSLKSEMKSVDDKLELSFFRTTRPSDVLPDTPVLLICVTSSRLGTDVINATQGITLAPYMALMIFHHKDEHALPNQASERVLTAKELRGVGGIFDMAFKSDKGIYTCDMNSNTVASVVTFLRRKTT